MKVINITIKDRHAAADFPAVIVCGNSDYKIKFDFDAEWDDYEIKTARFYFGGEYIEAVFTGNVCDVPILNNITGVYIGVFAGDLRTTTPAYIACELSIIDMGGGRGAKSGSRNNPKRGGARKKHRRAE